VFERYTARHIELARSDTDGAVRVDVNPAFSPDVGPGLNPGLNPGIGPEGRMGISAGVGPGSNPGSNPRGGPGLNGAALTLERYRDTQRRYWMDR
jgi:competence protein ComEC